MAFPIAALAPVIAAGVSGAASIASQAVANRKNIELMREQNKFSLDATREMNSWNHPVNELARLRGAGISPGIMYDNGVSGNFQSSPATPAGTPDIKPLPFGEALNNFTQTVIGFRQIKMQETDTVSKIALRDAQSLYAVASAGLSIAETKKILELLGYDIERAKIINSREEQGLVMDILKLSGEALDQELKKQNVALNEMSLQQAAYDLEMTKEQLKQLILMFPHKMRNLDSQTYLNYVSGENGRRQVEILAGNLAELERHNVKTEKQHTVDRWVGLVGKVLSVGAGMASGALIGKSAAGTAAGLAGAADETYQFGGLSPYE